METAYFAGGCFWCVESVFRHIKGVDSVVSGYINGLTLNPTYQEVCTGSTGFAEVVKINFDPKIISYKVLLEVFFAIHDPTQLNRQGADVGSQYRSGIYYTSSEQENEARELIEEIKIHFEFPIVTEIKKAEKFFAAEEYHQDYFAKNPEAGYCQAVVAPKYLKAKVKFNNIWK